MGRQRTADLGKLIQAGTAEGNLLHELVIALRLAMVCPRMLQQRSRDRCIQRAAGQQQIHQICRRRVDGNKQRNGKQAAQISHREFARCNFRIDQHAAHIGVGRRLCLCALIDQVADKKVTDLPLLRCRFFEQYLGRRILKQSRILLRVLPRHHQRLHRSLWSLCALRDDRADHRRGVFGGCCRGGLFVRTVRQHPASMPTLPPG